MPVIECTLEQLLHDGDWEEVFKPSYAAPECVKATQAVIFSKASADSFSREDVKSVIASVDGDNDGPDWVMVGELIDGRFFTIRAGCDYTGWG